MLHNYKKIPAKYEFGVVPPKISNYIHLKVWDETTYSFLNFNGASIEVDEWVSNFTPYFIG